MNGKRQQGTVLEEDRFQTGAIADNDILRAENRAREVAAIGTAEDFDQVFMPFKIAFRLMDQLGAFHKNPWLYQQEACHSKNRNSKLHANSEMTLDRQKMGAVTSGEG